jgi:hypothetical protein
MVNFPRSDSDIEIEYKIMILTMICQNIGKSRHFNCLSDNRGYTANGEAIPRIVYNTSQVLNLNKNSNTSKNRPHRRSQIHYRRGKREELRKSELNGGLKREFSFIKR